MAEGRTAVGGRVGGALRRLLHIPSRPGYRRAASPWPPPLQAALSSPVRRARASVGAGRPDSANSGQEAGSVNLPGVMTRHRHETGWQSHESQRAGLDPRWAPDNVGDYRMFDEPDAAPGAATRAPYQRSGQTPRSPQAPGRPTSIRWRISLPVVCTGSYPISGFGCPDVGGCCRAAMQGAEEQCQTRLDQQPPGSGSAALPGAVFLLHGGAALERRRAHPGGVKALQRVFVAIGAGMALGGCSATRARSGATVVWSATRNLPSRRKAAGLGSPPSDDAGAAAPRAAQRRPRTNSSFARGAITSVDEASSGSPGRRSTGPWRLRNAPPGTDVDMRLVAQFPAPDDAPAHGAQRSGERADWRLELLGCRGSLELAGL